MNNRTGVTDSNYFSKPLRPQLPWEHVNVFNSEHGRLIAFVLKETSYPEDVKYDPFSRQGLLWTNIKSVVISCPEAGLIPPEELRKGGPIDTSKTDKRYLNLPSDIAAQYLSMYFGNEIKKCLPSELDYYKISVKTVVFGESRTTHYVLKNPVSEFLLDSNNWVNEAELQSIRISGKLSREPLLGQALSEMFVSK